jgi:hypothetical protein
MKKITVVLLMFVSLYSNSQDIIYNENFGGGGTGGNQYTITSYYAGTSPNTFQSSYPIVYSGNSNITAAGGEVYNYNAINNGKISTTLTTSNQSNSSGLSFAYMMVQQNEFIIENINSLNKTNIVLSFGVRVGRNSASSMNYLKIEQSIDGINWSPIIFLAPPPNQWATITCNTPLLSNELLKLRFKQERQADDIEGYGTTSIDDIKITGTQTLNILENNMESFKIYPNPAQDNIEIDLGNLSYTNNWHYKILNSLGQQLNSGVISSKLTNVNLNTQGRGIYFVNIYNNLNNLVQTKKLIIK